MRPAPTWLKRTLLAGCTLLVLWQGWYLGWVLWWKWADPEVTHFMTLRLEALQEKKPKAVLKHTWVPYARVSVHLKRAVIASEDDKFIDHDGFDWEGIQKAIEKNQRRGKIVAGGSTISQQLAKNLFLSASKTPWRKVQEAIITLMIEMIWDKRRILEVYLNVVEWGEGLFGAEAAARRYFGVSATGLSAEQGARLAVMLPAPRRFEKNPWSGYLDARTFSVMDRMKYSEIP
ncbi:MAG: monofunctional biosynthetic peptidoglycan transglycosylase [Rhodocyclaceae bacterium]|nr:monofunctional biosynthetic peptidoglycan transglycosylase [Rhodocyclaceae bacterium]